MKNAENAENLDENSAPALEVWLIAMLQCSPTRISRSDAVNCEIDEVKNHHENTVKPRHSHRELQPWKKSLHKSYRSATAFFLSAWWSPYLFGTRRLLGAQFSLHPVYFYSPDKMFIFILYGPAAHVENNKIERSPSPPSFRWCHCICIICGRFDWRLDHQASLFKARWTAREKQANRITSEVVGKLWMDFSFLAAGWMGTKMGKIDKHIGWVWDGKIGIIILEWTCCALLHLVQSVAEAVKMKSGKA